MSFCIQNVANKNERLIWKRSNNLLRTIYRELKPNIRTQRLMQIQCDPSLTVLFETIVLNGEK